MWEVLSCRFSCYHSIKKHSSLFGSPEYVSFFATDHDGPFYGSYWTAHLREQIDVFPISLIKQSYPNCDLPELKTDHSPKFSQVSCSDQ